MQDVARAFLLAALNDGSSMAARTAMIEVVTSSSINVNPQRGHCPRAGLK